ncbi:MAG: ATP-binding protein, partial [Clostridia bacterium]|nr:ATP-binding protein [Clostridia bacterium]
DIDMPGIHTGMRVSAFMRMIWREFEDLQSREAQEDFSARFTAERLNKDYEEGHYEQSFSLCRVKDGQIQWLRSDLVLRYNPNTGHLMCFDYIWDVMDAYISRDIMRRLAFANCEAFMSVYMPTRRCLQYEVGDAGALSKSETIYGETDTIFQLAQRMSDSDAQTLLRNVSLDVVARQLSQKTYYQLYATLRDETGKRLDKSLSFFYVNQSNNLLGVSVEDVTEVRASEVRHAQLLAEALEAAEKADAAKSQFLSRVSHEMRTPLNAIIGFIDLAKGADAEKVASCLASSDIAARQLLNVINDVLDMSSIESGKMRIAKTSFNFKHLLTSITNIYGAQCKQTGVLFETKLDKPIDDWLVGDELRLNQILMNLLGNAVKFTSAGHIWLTVSQTGAIGEKEFLRFTVADTGCGMSEQMKERLFKPFEQESVETARKYGGSGLGLSIVKNLVNMMGGSIRVESKLGEGSVFTVDLPFEKSDLGRDMALPTNIDALRILAVDDEAPEREYIKLVLARMGVRFTCADGGDEALAALARAEAENDPYNVCLVDWRMPRMSGLETTKRIR